MKAKWDGGVCRGCAVRISKGDEINYREDFCLCLDCTQLFDNGMTDKEKAAKAEADKRAAARRVRANRRRAS